MMLGVAAIACAPSAALAAGSLIDDADVALTFVIPLIEIAKVRAAALYSGAIPGRFSGRQTLASPRQRTVTMPNNDTVYASAFVDLGNGPAEFRLPGTGGRYASLQIMDFYGNNAAVIVPFPDTSEKRVRVVGPGQQAQPTDIVSSTPWIWALARVVVNGPDDLDDALALRSRFSLVASPGASSPAAPPMSGQIDEILAASRALLKENGVGNATPKVRESLTRLGIDPDRDAATIQFGAEEKSQISAGFERARARARNHFGSGQVRNGWLYSDPATGIFGTDFELRAAVATFGLAALPISEATYVRAVAEDGKPQFDGPGPWRLHFAAGELPPVEAFWSITIYTATPGGQYYLVDNPIDRFAIGDRTAGLARNGDGSLDIWIARSSPGPDRESNWLPAPRQGPFAVVLRAYRPRQALLDGKFLIPRIVRQ